ncbi:hypothetical protein QJS10_CPB18g01104 [Acorus calamus]|uniref:Uncharacterized protein n=1 Tax=Acorus calamus TaxID=4465 RepID=A0AAV9CLB6_ACOCL|nr:hypothetical protein QJS10_CPB18g01104 [Acorus calamus]
MFIIRGVVKEKDLILRDNRLTKIPDVSIFKDLIIFDVSFNEIPSLNGLSRSQAHSRNYMSSLANVRTLIMENLQTLTNLQELWLGRNRIRTVNLCGLKCIRKISLQSNRLTSMIGFQDCVALEELYLSHNGIAKMEGLSSLENLRVLDVSSNKLTSVDDIESLTRLEDLWLNDNQIVSLDVIGSAVLGSREKLTTIYLEHNPCAKSPDYSTTLRQIFPNLQQVDSDVFL